MRAAVAALLAVAALCAQADDASVAAPADVARPAAPSSAAATRINEALRKGDAAGALALADEFLAAQPRDAQVRFLRAVVLGDLKRTDEAMAALESITQDYPELPEPYNNLAVIRANQGQLASAQHLLQLAIAAQPGYVTAHENLGDLYVSMAAAEYGRAAQLEPNNAPLKRKLALARELGGRLRSAP